MILDTSFLIDVLRGNEAVTEWEAELDERGVGVEDLMIAATALQRDEPILTANPDRFERVEGVDVETY